MNPLLFLDIDGVLCTYRSHLGSGFYGGSMKEWDPMSCGLIKRACHEHDFRIVISSTWRTPHPKQLSEFIKNDTSKLVVGLKKHGLIDYLQNPDWKTPFVEIDNSCRGHEIEEYLKRFQVEYECTPEYVILDDLEDMLPEQESHFIRTDFYEGFGYRNLEEINDYMKIRAKFPDSTYSIQGNSRWQDNRYMKRRERAT